MPASPYFKPKSGRFGKHIVHLAAAQYPGLTTLTASSTVYFDVATPYRKLHFEKASVQARTNPGFSAGTVPATVFRVRAGTSTAITASLTLDAMSSGVNAFTLLSTASANDFYINEGDHFEVQVSLGTQSCTTVAVGLTFVIEAGLLE